MVVFVSFVVNFVVNQSFLGYTFFRKTVSWLLLSITEVYSGFTAKLTLHFVDLVGECIGFVKEVGFVLNIIL